MNRAVSVLVVDDDEVDQMAIERSFKRQKIANPIFAARDGIQALEQLRGTNGGPKVTRPYVILLDLKMPRMNGLEFLAELRRDPEHKQAIVFVLTTSRDERDKLGAYDHHVAGYILKSNVSREFVEVISLLDHYWRIVEMPIEDPVACAIA
ncbi:Response regulator rcp1 [Phycisphaerae bacterium RAS1]|nr:Response regulator rcp1 [Phycisphaerae bacterium RAS1]